MTRFELPLGASNPLTLFAGAVMELQSLKTEDRKLKTCSRDIDSQRMQIRVDSGKGQKTRMVPMAPRLLAALREYWLAYRPEVYLFPGKTPDTPLQPTTIQKMFKVAAKEAGILKHVTPHTRAAPLTRFELTLGASNPLTLFALRHRPTASAEN